MNRIVFLLLIVLFSTSLSRATVLTSPDEKIKIEITTKDKVYYAVYYGNERVLDFSPISLTLSDKVFGVTPVIIDSAARQIRQTINTVWGVRNAIDDHYNELTLSFAGDFKLEFRAYNYGVAYRFVTSLNKKQIFVMNEEVSYRFQFGVSAWMADTRSYESNYKRTKLDVSELTNFNNANSKIFLPIVVQTSPKVKVMITEAGLYDYPSLFLDRGNDYENFLNGRFEKYALTTKTGGFSNYAEIAHKEADYIASTSGSREFPWRVMIVSDDDRRFVDCDMVYQLSKPTVLKDTEWIKPGKVAWEWWHDYAVEGQSFRGGVNTNTYLYQIDFAAKYNIEYILIDWMWTDKYDLTLINPDIDIKKIVEYGKSKNVKIFVWSPGHTLHKQAEKAIDLLASLGISGIKADFFGREDQTGIKMYEDLARATANRKMLIVFHGCTKPTGLSRTYPNIINYEAVLGNEWNKLHADKVNVNHKVILPFIRGTVGPMDYTPGGMRNLQGGSFLRYTLPNVHGTRSNEMALYVIYHEPLKMLCDAPSAYNREPEITRFIADIPTTWDETKVLDAKFGEYVIIARRKNTTWYIAGITGSKEYVGNIDLSFLGKGNYPIVALRDGINSDRIGTDYTLESATLETSKPLAVKMVSGGGFVIKVTK